MLIIDRFEGDFAVCEDDNLHMIHIKRSDIPPQAAEGDCLNTDPQKGYVLDADETARRRARVQKKMDRLFA